MPQINDLTEEEIAQILARRKQQEASPSKPALEEESSEDAGYLTRDQVDSLILADAILIATEYIPPDSILVKRLYQARLKLLAYADIPFDDKTGDDAGEPDFEDEEDDDGDGPAIQIG